MRPSPVALPEPSGPLRGVNASLSREFLAVVRLVNVKPKKLNLSCWTFFGLAGNVTGKEESPRREPQALLASGCPDSQMGGASESTGERIQKPEPP